MHFLVTVSGLAAPQMYWVAVEVVAVFPYASLSDLSSSPWPLDLFPLSLLCYPSMPPTLTSGPRHQQCIFHPLNRSSLDTFLSDTIATQ